MISRWRALAAPGTERGAATTLEAVAMSAVLMLVVVLLAVIGAVLSTSSAVSAAAAAGARAASVKSQPRPAQAAGEAAASAALTETCAGVAVSVDVSQMANPTPGSAVTATVSCTRSWPLIGSHTLTATEASPIEVNREGP